MGVFSAMAILIAYPWLALLPAAVFFGLFLRLRKPLILATAISWLCYVPYEYGMMLRLLCSGECNIRVDLLLIYTLLIALSLSSLVAFAVKLRRA